MIRCGARQHGDLDDPDADDGRARRRAGSALPSFVGASLLALSSLTLGGGGFAPPPHLLSAAAPPVTAASWLAAAARPPAASAKELTENQKVGWE